MKINATKAYGFKDYAMSALFLTLPFLIGYDVSGAKAWVPMTLGGGVLVYSIITRYELSAFKLLSFPAHLLLDLAGGLLLAFSPWIFGFSDKVYLPHLVLGLVQVGFVLATAIGSPDVRRNLTYLKSEVFQNPALQN
ncbi:MAG: hypothetical protein EOP49_15725 [Sphingobacteriales bacterium]|nr:MAG: hypothetical protein EOP49_15725 [Sphingobacteriales bacterium]